MTKKAATTLKNWLNRMPFYVRIGPVDYPIKWRKELKIDGREKLGAFSRSGIELAQSIASDESSDGIKEVLLHEIVHGIWYHFGAGLSKWNEEPCTEVMGNGLAALFRDNPKLVKWLSA